MLCNPHYSTPNATMWQVTEQHLPTLTTETQCLDTLYKCRQQDLNPHWKMGRDHLNALRLHGRRPVYFENKRVQAHV